MDKRILKQRLEHHRWHGDGVGGLIALDPTDEILSKPRLLNGEIFFQRLELPRQRFQRPWLLQGKTQVVAKILRHPLHRIGVVSAGDYGVEGVEEKVGVHLRLQMANFVFSGERFGLHRPQFTRHDLAIGFHPADIGLVGIFEQVEAKIDRIPDTRPEYSGQQRGGQRGIGRGDDQRHNPIGEHKHIDERHDASGTGGERPFHGAGAIPNESARHEPVHATGGEESGGDADGHQPPGGGVSGAEGAGDTDQRAAEGQPEDDLERPERDLPTPDARGDRRMLLEGFHPSSMPWGCAGPTAKQIGRGYFATNSSSIQVVGSLSHGYSGGLLQGIRPRRRSTSAAQNPSRGNSRGSQPGRAAALTKASIRQPSAVAALSISTAPAGRSAGSSLVRGITAATATGWSAKRPPPVGSSAKRWQNRPALWLAPVGRVAIQRWRPSLSSGRVG